MNVKDITHQVDTMWNSGRPTTNVYLNHSDYADLLIAEGNYTLSSHPNFFPLITPGGHQFYVNQETPDYSDDEYYYYFKHKTFVTVESWRKFVGTIEAGPKLKLYSTIEYMLPAKALAEYNRLVITEPTPSYCSHYNKKAVWLIKSAFWLCNECKKDLGTLTQNEMIEERKKIRSL